MFKTPEGTWENILYDDKFCFAFYSVKKRVEQHFRDNLPKKDEQIFYACSEDNKIFATKSLFKNLGDSLFNLHVILIKKFKKRHTNIVHVLVSSNHFQK
jgi:hypothetical protein